MRNVKQQRHPWQLQKIVNIALEITKLLLNEARDELTNLCKTVTRVEEMEQNAHVLNV